MAISQIIGASIADGAIAAIDITDGTITTAKLAATTGSGSVVLSTSPTITGNLTVSGTQTNSALTSGRITYASTGGLLTDSSALTFDGTTVTATKFAGALNGSLGATTPSTVVATSVTNSSLTAGRVTYANTSGLLTDSSNLQFDGTNLGLGVTPSAWGSIFKVTQIGSAYPAFVAGRTDSQSQIHIGANAYYDGTNWTYVNTGYASRYFQSDSSHVWQTAPSSSGTITFTSAMTLDASGYLGIGTTAPSSFGGLAVRKAATVSSVPVSASFSDSANSTFDIRHSANIVNLSAQGSGITIDTGNSTRMTITDTGLVGIGTTSPADALNIGTGKKFRATHSANVYQQIFSSASGNFLNAYGDNFELNADSGAIYLTVTAAQPMVFQTTNTERMRISAAGLVGIGTTSPDAQLDVTRSGDGQIAVLQTSANRGFSFESQSNTALQISSVQASTNMDLWANTLSFSAGGSERMRLDASGNLLVGATSTVDSAKVQFSGAKTLSSGIPQGQLNISDTTAIAVGVGGAIAFSALYNGSSYTTLGSVEGVRETATVGHYGGNLVFRVRANFGDNAERMRILSTGEVGIGTSSPAFKTEIVGGVTTVETTLLQIRSDAGGIGTGSTIALGNSTNPSAGSGRVELAGIRTTASGGSFVVRTGDDNGTIQERMRINSSGNVGIGITNPTAKLTVKGQTHTAPWFAAERNGSTTLQFKIVGAETTGYTASTGTVSAPWTNVIDNNNSDLMLSTSLGGGTGGNIILDGKVGIGTVSPVAQLDIENSSAQPFGTAAQLNAIFKGSVSIGQGGAIGFDYFGNHTNAPTSMGYAIESQAGSTKGSLVFGTRSVTTDTAPTERMRITSAGYTKISNTGTYEDVAQIFHEFRADNTNSYVLVVSNSNSTPASEYMQDWRYTASTPNNTSARFWSCTDATAVRAYMLSNGGIANYQANDSNLSDSREKTNFTPAKSYLNVICAIPVQTFNYIDQNLEEDDGLTLGVVAQDVQVVAPELVKESNWGTKEEPKMRLSIYQTDLQYALMKCIQEQQTLIESLTTRLTALEGK